MTARGFLGLACFLGPGSWSQGSRQQALTPLHTHQGPDTSDFTPEQAGTSHPRTHSVALNVLWTLLLEAPERPLASWRAWPPGACLQGPSHVALRSGQVKQGAAETLGASPAPPLACWSLRAPAPAMGLTALGIQKDTTRPPERDFMGTLWPGTLFRAPCAGRAALHPHPERPHFCAKGECCLTSSCPLAKGSREQPVAVWPAGGTGQGVEDPEGLGEPGAGAGLADPAVQPPRVPFENVSFLNFLSLI